MFWFLPLIGAAAGALANKKDPVKGALMGAGIAATGGAAAGALGAGAAAGGAAGAGAAGTAAGAGAGAAGSGLLAAEGASAASAAGGGLLGGSGLSGSLVGSGALTSSGANAAALGGSQLGGSLLTSGALAPAGGEAAAFGAGGIAAEQAAAPVVDQGSSAGLLDKANFQMGGNYDNLMKTGKNANSVYGQYQQNKPQQPVAQPMPLQNKPLDLTPIINDASKMQEYDMSENERRKRMMAQYAQFAGGGY